MSNNVRLHASCERLVHLIDLRQLRIVRVHQAATRKVTATFATYQSLSIGGQRRKNRPALSDISKQFLRDHFVLTCP